MTTDLLNLANAIAAPINTMHVPPHEVTAYYQSEKRRRQELTRELIRAHLDRGYPMKQALLETYTLIEAAHTRLLNQKRQM